MARELGVDQDELWNVAGVARSDRRYSAGVSVQSFLALLEAGAHLSNDPLFGLHLGQRLRIADIPGYGLALCACRTYGVVLRLALRFECLAHDLGRTELTVSDGIAQISMRSPWLDLPGGRHVIEFAAASVRAQTNWIAGVELPLIEIASPFPPAPGVSLDAYEKAFGMPVIFGAKNGGVKFSADLLDERVPNADTGFFATLTDWAEQRLQTRKRKAEASTVIPRARGEIRARLRRGDANLSQVAKALNLSDRSLQRRLSDAGRSFTELVDDTRRELVYDYLRDDTLPLSEIASLLGFDDQSNFNHKFHLWFGSTPKSVRESLKNEARG